MKKRIFSLLLLCLAALFVLSSCTGSETKGLTFTLLENGTLQVSGYTGTEDTVFIPGTHEGKAVTSVGKRAFERRTDLVSVTFPAGLTAIGEYAFFGCENLSSVTFSEPDGWYAGAVSLSAEDLSDPARAAQALDLYGYTAWSRH